jgi:cation diffusion facilitator CzcD-associated flavoprotein CzcO
VHESRLAAVDNGETRTHVPLLVIGAGPYGLATAACAKSAGIEQIVVGKPMAFWRENMPAGMFLRSGPDWHLDAAGVHTFMAYLDERGIDPSEVDPIPVALFLDYVDWFRERADIDVLPDLVRDLSKPDGHFEATLWSPPRASPTLRSSRSGSSEVCRRGAGRTPATWSGSTSFAESGY